MPTGFCPDCDETLDVGNHPKKGQIVTCDSCGAYLQIASTSPVELDWAYDDYEDDDDDYEYDDDDY